MAQKNQIQPKAAGLDELNHALSVMIAKWTTKEGDFATPVPSLSLFRREHPSKPIFCMVEPSVLIVVQGEKKMWVGDDAYRYNNSHFLVTSLDLAGKSEVLTASVNEPCLGLLIKLDLSLLTDLIVQSHLPPLREKVSGVGVGIGTVTPTILEPIKRLMALADEPDSISVLAPLIQREIHYRLLQSDQAYWLRQIASIDSQGHRISRAIDWLKMNYSEPLRVDELASKVQMSTPTFHHHFRQLTTMSPLQYQKWLRLNEAKRLMLSEHLNAASAAIEVGYESPSQFSREYTRLFGAPPKRDIENLRQQVATAH